MWSLLKNNTFSLRNICMHITFCTLFPDAIKNGLSSYSIMKRAEEKNLAHFEYVNIRDYSTDSYKSVDGRPYGGGHGMILRVDVIHKCITHILSHSPFSRSKIRVILTDCRGKRYTQKSAERFSSYDQILLISGHYEGVDERVREYIDEEVSIGDYVLTGGELPSMVIADSVVRLLPGVLKLGKATLDESYTDRSLEYPQYTEPRVYRKKYVPDILLSGNHEKIAEWKKSHALTVTRIHRPDLLLRKKDNK